MLEKNHSTEVNSGPHKILRPHWVMMPDKKRVTAQDVADMTDPQSLEAVQQEVEAQLAAIDKRGENSMNPNHPAFHMGSLGVDRDEQVRLTSLLGLRTNIADRIKLLTKVN